MPRFFVTGIRHSMGTNTDEGAFDTEAEATKQLDGLANDPDCILAEVERFEDRIGATSIVAQAERVDGHWRRVGGELRTRTRAGEAEAIYRQR